jgi:hypothetical protein
MLRTRRTLGAPTDREVDASILLGAFGTMWRRSRYDSVTVGSGTPMDARLNEACR